LDLSTQRPVVWLVKARNEPDALLRDRVRQVLQYPVLPFPVRGDSSRPVEEQEEGRLTRFVDREAKPGRGWFVTVAWHWHLAGGDTQMAPISHALAWSSHVRRPPERGWHPGDLL